MPGRQILEDSLFSRNVYRLQYSHDLGLLRYCINDYEYKDIEFSFNFVACSICWSITSIFTKEFYVTILLNLRFLIEKKSHTFSNQTLVFVIWEVQTNNP